MIKPILNVKNVKLIFASTLLITVLAACGSSSESSSSSVQDSQNQDVTTQLSDENNCIAAASAYNVLVQDIIASIGSPSSFDKEKWLASVEEARKVVPDELAVDFEELASAYEKAADVLVNLGDAGMAALTDPSKISELESATAVFEDPKLQEIGERLNEFFLEECV